MKIMLTIAIIAAAAGAALAQTGTTSPSTAPTGTPTPTPTAMASPVPVAPVPARRGAIMQACSADIQSLCPGMTPGDGKLGPCIRQNRAKLSTPCQTALQSLRGAGRFGQPQP